MMAERCGMGWQVGHDAGRCGSGCDLERHVCEKGNDTCPCWDGQGCCMAPPPAVAGCAKHPAARDRHCFECANVADKGAP